MGYSRLTGKQESGDIAPMDATSELPVRFASNDVQARLRRST
jgi:hypothetical protein